MTSLMSLLKRKRKLFLIFLIAISGFLSLALLNSINLEYTFSSSSASTNHQPNNDPVVQLKNEIDLIRKKMRELEKKENDYANNLNRMQHKYEEFFDKRLMVHDEAIREKLLEEMRIKVQFKPNDDDDKKKMSVADETMLNVVRERFGGMGNEKKKKEDAGFDKCMWYEELDASQTNNTDIRVSNLYDVLDFINARNTIDNSDSSINKKLPSYDVYEIGTNEWTNEKKLNIIITPHSHNDPGWLLTFEEYFDEATKNILNTVVEALSEKETRTFIWAEISYLSLWWQQANQTMRAKMRRLIVETKQLEIVTGGWVMTDEANSYYYAMIEQMIEGHEWLKTNIDERIAPTHGWSIDPFGYSSTMAYLLKQMGFEAMLIQRVHYFLKEYMKFTQRFEFEWRQSWSTKSSKSTDMFCHVMPYGHYDVPSTCGPDSFICCQFDFKRLKNAIPCPGEPAIEITDENIEKRAKMLLDQYKRKAKLYGSENNHNVVFIPLGDDFRWKNMQEAHDQYQNYEKLIDFMNKKSEWNVNVKFGTLGDYFQLAKAFNKNNVETLSGDFFTYADSYENYWSGYFTSRAYFKRLDRVVEYYLRAGEILFSFANILQTIRAGGGDRSNIHLYEQLLEARRNLGIFQHHDGITGTAKKAVVLDYEKKLMKSLENSRNVIEMASSYLLTSSKSSSSSFGANEKHLSINDLKLNKHIDIDLLNDNDEQSVVLFNPSTNHRHELVSFRINTPFVRVYDEKDAERDDFKLSLIWPNNVELNLPDERVFPAPDSAELPTPTSFGSDFDTNHIEIVFKITMEPLSFYKFKLKKSMSSILKAEKFAQVTYFSSSLLKNSDVLQIKSVIRKKKMKNSDFSVLKLDEMIEIRNIVNKHALIQVDLYGGIKANINGKTGLVDHFMLPNGEKLVLESEFLTYTSFRSGAYLFLPDGPAKSIDYDRLLKWIRVERGDTVRQRICTNLTIVLHCIDLMPSIDDAIGHEYPVMNVWNMVDLRSSRNYELVMSFNPSIDTNDTLYTDLNGFQYTKRKIYQKLPIQGNVYPMPSGAFIQDTKLRMTLLAAQPSGVSSSLAAKRGKLNVFLDRKLEQDDFKGLEEAANDNRQTHSRFILMFEKLNSLNQHSSSSFDQPTLLSQIYSFHLLNPIIKMNNAGGGKLKSSESLMPVDVPCDLRVLNVRTMQKSVNEPKENNFGLVLHRLVANQLMSDCSSTQTATVLVSELPRFYKQKCASNKSSLFTFIDLLSYFSQRLADANKRADVVVENTLLTLTSLRAEHVEVNKRLRERKNAIKVLDLIEPMQIEAFIVTFYT